MVVGAPARSQGIVGNFPPLVIGNEGYALDGTRLWFSAGPPSGPRTEGTPTRLGDGGAVRSGADTARRSAGYPLGERTDPWETAVPRLQPGRGSVAANRRRAVPGSPRKASYCGRLSEAHSPVGNWSLVIRF